MTARTIDEVLEGLDRAVERAVDDGNRIGYFAVVYRTVTAQVRAGLEADFFDDAERMERLDVLFADRFLDALETGRRGGSRPSSLRCPPGSSTHRSAYETSGWPTLRLGSMTTVPEGRGQRAIPATRAVAAPLR